MMEEKEERKWNYLLFRDSVEGPDVARELMAEETLEREWNYLLFRDGVEWPDVVLLGDGSKEVDGGRDSGE